MTEQRPNKPTPRGDAKDVIAAQLETDLRGRGYKVVERDFARPWGGFLKIDNNQAPQFVAEYFAGVPLPKSTEGARLDPKLLVVDPKARLSWQVHERRGEYWRVVDGPVGAVLSETDEHPEEVRVFQNGETIDIPVGTRHRLVGLDERGTVAEIWINTDPKNPSDEADIRRISDDSGRK